MTKPTLYLFVGYPGAGKTTIAKIIEQVTGAAHIWADHERRALFENPTHSHDESMQLYAKLNAETSRLLTAGKSVIFDTNFNFVADREHLRHIAEQCGAKTVLVWVCTDRELAKRRAIHESHGRHTRIYGNMTADDFERIASKLEAPSADEQAISIDGSDVQAADIIRELDLK